MKWVFPVLLLCAAACSQADNPVADGRRHDAAASAVQAPSQGRNMYIQIGRQGFTASLAQTPAADELRRLLLLILDMEDHAQNEKYARLPRRLPAQDEAVGRVEAGDIMLWQGDTVVIFYESFTTPYRYTRLGRIDEAAGLKAALGQGGVRVRMAGQP